MLLTSAVAVLFETLPVLRGGAGNIVVVFCVGVSWSRTAGHHWNQWLDPLGNMTMANSMIERVRTPIFPDTRATLRSRSPINLIEVVQSFRWEGVPWTASRFCCGWPGAASRLCWFCWRRGVRPVYSSRWFARPTKERRGTPHGGGLNGGAAESQRGGRRFYKRREQPSECFAADRATKAPARLTRSPREIARARLCVFLSPSSSSRSRVCAGGGTRWPRDSYRAGCVAVAIARQQILALHGCGWCWSGQVWERARRDSELEHCCFHRRGFCRDNSLASWLAGFALAVVFGSPAALRIFVAEGRKRSCPCSLRRRFCRRWRLHSASGAGRRNRLRRFSPRCGTSARSTTFPAWTTPAIQRPSDDALHPDVSGRFRRSARFRDCDPLAPNPRQLGCVSSRCRAGGFRSRATVVHTFAQVFHCSGTAPQHLVGFVLDTTGSFAQNSRKVFVSGRVSWRCSAAASAAHRSWGKIDAVHAWFYGSVHQCHVRPARSLATR